MMNRFQAEKYPHINLARLVVGEREFHFEGHWIRGKPWDRFGLYNSYVIVRHDDEVCFMPAHAGELVPGSTEDLVAILGQFGSGSLFAPAPMTLELDPTYRCSSRDCGGRCFSSAYRRRSPHATIPSELLREIIIDFATAGGRVVRFDGGGDPLCHFAVRSGELPELCQHLNLKSTLLTSGDLFEHCDLHRLAQADCYVRISLNAASNETRWAFHGNAVPLDRIFAAIRQFADGLARENSPLPIGATFLLDRINFHEVLACAIRARDSGIAHFAVRRVLGPEALRPEFTTKEQSAIGDLLSAVGELSDEDFKVFVPWRDLNEPDVNPANTELYSEHCWQSIFKTVIEPDPATGGFCAQLCGRYRGGGLGQLQQMPPLFSSKDGAGWIDKWRHSFNSYFISRDALPNTCVSCIDRGFIFMMDRLVRFLGDPTKGFSVFHLFSRDNTQNEQAAGSCITRRGRRPDPLSGGLDLVDFGAGAQRDDVYSVEAPGG